MKDSQKDELIIVAGHTEGQYWRDILSYRGLFYFLAWRDILVRYKQTVIGIAWSVIRPLFTMVILTVVFGKLAGLPSGDTPYPILVFAAMLPWQLFSNAIGESSGSLVGNANLISKIYFPRLIITVSSIIASLVDFLISFVMLLILMAAYKFVPSWKIITLPFFMLLALFTALGPGILLSALNVKYRDFRYIIPFMVQFGLYISPVGFSSAVVPEKWRLLYSLNPMVGVIDGFRWAILGSDVNFYWPGAIISFTLTAIIFWLGIKYFRKTERTFADVI